MGKKYSYMSEEEYNKIKVLQSYGLTTTQAAKIVKRAASTLSYIFRSKDFKDYQRISQARFDRVEPNKPVDSLATALDNQNKQLDTILAMQDKMLERLDKIIYGK